LGAAAIEGDMAEQIRLNDAIGRFDTALRQFEAALVRSDEDRRRTDTVKGEAEALRQDRRRLEGELDQVRTKAFELVDTSKKAVGKIDAAMSRIRAVMHSNSGG
jgi:hypothetical protein